MTEIDLALGMLTGMLVVSALIVVVVIILEPGYRRKNTLQAQVGNAQKTKTIPVREKPSIFSRMMHAWGKGAKSEDSQREERLTGDEQSQPPALTADTQESKIEGVSPPIGQDEGHVNNELVSNPNPDADVKSASEEGVDTSGIDVTPASLTEEAASTEAGINDGKRVEMVDVSPKEEGRLANYSPKEEAKENPVSLSQAHEKGDWASAFTDIQVEESQAGKLAKNLNNVDIQDLFAQCRALIKPHKKRE
jgi:hypothetical protein